MGRSCRESWFRGAWDGSRASRAETRQHIPADPDGERGAGRYPPASRPARPRGLPAPAPRPARPSSTRRPPPASAGTSRGAARGLAPRSGRWTRPDGSRRARRRGWRAERVHARKPRRATSRSSRPSPRCRRRATRPRPERRHVDEDPRAPPPGPLREREHRVVVHGAERLAEPAFRWWSRGSRRRPRAHRGRRGPRPSGSPSRPGRASILHRRRAAPDRDDPVERPVPEEPPQERAPTSPLPPASHAVFMCRRV